jgi:hypothetical protein
MNLKSKFYVILRTRRSKWGKTLSSVVETCLVLRETLRCASICPFAGKGWGRLHRGNPRWECLCCLSMLQALSFHKQEGTTEWTQHKWALPFWAYYFTSFQTRWLVSKPVSLLQFIWVYQILSLCASLQVNLQV